MSRTNQKCVSGMVNRTCNRQTVMAAYQKRDQVTSDLWLDWKLFEDQFGCEIVKWTCQEEFTNFKEGVNTPSL